MKMNLLQALPIVLSLVSAPYAVTAQENSVPGSSTQPKMLTLEQILANLEQRNAQRAAALQQFEGKRT